MKKIISVILTLFIAVSAMLMLSSCGDTTSYGTHHVEMTFEDYGTIKLELYGDIAPITVKNFITLAKSGYYDGLTITRAQPNFVIQGGAGDEVGTIKGEFAANGVNNTISHKRGVISMARTTVYDSASSQFFICLSDAAAYSCDGYYAAFGIVTSGMDIIDKMVSDIPRTAFMDSNYFLYPQYQITIESVKVID